MTEEPSEPQRPGTPSASDPAGGDARRPVFLLVAGVVALAIVGGLVAWLLLRGGGDESAGTTVDREGAATVSAQDLNGFATTAEHPVYWAGPQPQFTYELTRTDDGRVYVRYLPAGANAGDPNPNYLTVGTYPQPDAFETLQETAEAQGVETFEVPGGGLAFQDKNRATSVYLAHPDSNYQIEVYAPSPETARALAESGQIKPLGTPPTPARAEAISVEELRRLPATLGHPIYWAGEEPDTTYELTRTSDGSVYIRYLPAGADVGVRRPDYLTVGTYPLENALETLREAADAKRVETVELEGGGVAFVDRETPTSVYLAFPDEDVQVEVYEPDAARARELAISGQIASVR